jgi:hypothetical protein
MYMNISILVCRDISVKKKYYIVKILFFVMPIKVDLVAMNRRICEKLTIKLYCLFINHMKKEKVNE